jgi:plastocyanin
MRSLYFFTIIGISVAAGVWATFNSARASGYGRVVYYYPAPHIVYYQSYTPRYYSRSDYYSYSSPSVYYVRPIYCEPPSYQQSDASGHSRSQQPSPAQPTTTATVGAYDNRFLPQTLNVQPGTTVRWVNYGQHNHTITADDDSWDSGDIKPGATYSATFRQPGIYYYYCRHHTQDKMQGTIVVAAGRTNGQSAAPSSGY